jgi:hypothetical protein
MVYPVPKAALAEHKHNPSKIKRPKTKQKRNHHHPTQTTMKFQPAKLPVPTLLREVSGVRSVGEQTKI